MTNIVRLNAKCVLSAASVCAAVLAQGEPSVAVSAVGMADTRNIRSQRAEITADTRLPIAGRSVLGSADTRSPGSVIIFR